MDLVDQFILYTKGQRTSPLYRKWSAITMIAGAMERRIYSRNGSYTNYPHLYTMLAGPPGSGKGVIDLVRDLWRSTTNNLGVPAFYVGVDDSTKAALVDALLAASQIYIETNYKYHCLLLPVEEFSNFFPYPAPDLLSFLTKIWNYPPDYKEDRRKNGKTIIEKPLITALLGYQPDVMNKVLMKEGSDQGFLRRTILIWNKKAEKNPLFESPPLDALLKKQICQRLTEISLLEGEMKWTENAWTHLQEWDAQDGPPTPTHPKLHFYLETRTPHAIKLSMIASISESNEMTIHMHHVKRAINWLLEAEVVMPEVFESMKEEDSDIEAMEGLYAYALKQQSGGYGVTDGNLIRWLSKKVPQQKVKTILNSMEMIGSFVRRPDATWRVTGKSPRDI